ncbi:glycerophosphodiester phosphodiesterase [Crenobacter sp. SG2305]|uniref:glycerophosphodiester phosphodiesterase n=1 Tax=Crenobacter oryzisoli TaxID=3056844 RepID=UPI0025AB4CCA|nr:glycerophosphodiester phosphodiesterase [Crenobacter sp. SG2305]MDN0081859.1 glycerophosphodiester phosphodiesterase [Crenobacter sp. SG2305]
MSSSWSFPRLIAHRGGGRLAPENTLAGMRCAVEHGYRAVEFDVKLSADDHPYLLHDDDLDRTTDGHGPARPKTWAELARLDAGSWLSARFAGELLPDLATIAAYCREQGLWANVEIKPCLGREEETGALVSAAVATLWAGGEEKVLLSSFSETALAAAQRAAPHLARGMLFEVLPQDWAAIAARLGCASVHVDGERLNAEQATAIRSSGYRLLVYTVNNTTAAERLFEWGVDGVITDALPELAALG